MGNSTSNESKTLSRSDLFCPVCYVKENLKPIECGHFFCLPCLLTLRERNDGAIVCPFDKKSTLRDPQLIDDINEKSVEKLDLGIFLELRKYSDSRRREPNFKSNLSASLACRWMTVATLRDIATLLDSVELRGSKVQVGSLSACIAGGLAVTAGLGLTLSGVGSPVGIPLLVGGAAVGGSGAIGSFSANIMEILSRRTNVRKVNMILQIDNFLSEQLLIMAQRAEKDVELAASWDLSYLNGFGFALIFPNIAKLGAAGMAGAKTAAMAGTRMATLSIYHGVGLFLAAVMIPVDIAQLVSVSIKIHKEDPSSLVKEIRNLADKLEVQLKIFYLQFGFFQLVQCHKIHASRAAISTSNSDISTDVQFKTRELKSGSTSSSDAAEISPLGTISCEHAEEYSPEPQVINLTLSSRSKAAKTSRQNSSQENVDDNFLIVSEAEEIKIPTPEVDLLNSVDLASSSHVTPMWVYACIDPLHAEELQLYQDIGRVSSDILTYEEVKKWGKVIFQGEGQEPPEDVKVAVEDEWFSLIYPEIEFVDISSTGEEEPARGNCVVSTKVMDLTFDAKGDADLGGGSLSLG